jgi:hypothetical protein
MFNNVVSYYSNEHSDSKRNFGLQSDLGQKLKETVNHYHNYNLQIKIKNEAPKHKKPYAPQLNVSSSSSEGDNSKYYENFINNLVETTKSSSAQIAKRKKSKTYKLNKNDLEMIKQQVNTINHKSKGESSCASSGNSNNNNKRRSSKKKKTNISNNNNNNNNSNRKSTFLKGRLTFTDDVMAFNQKFNEVKSINIKRKGVDILKKVLAEVNKENNNDNKNLNKNNINYNYYYNKGNQCSTAQTLLKHTNTEGDINKRNKHFSEDTVQTLVLNKKLQNYNCDNSKGTALNYGSERRNFTNDKSNKSNKSQFSNNTNRNLIGNSQLFPTQNFLEIKKEESFCIRKKKTNEIIQNKKSLTSNKEDNNDGCESKKSNNNNCEEGNVIIKKALSIENDVNVNDNNIEQNNNNNKRPSLFYQMKKISNNDKDEGNIDVKENINDNYFQKEIIENKHCSEESNSNSNNNNNSNNDSNNKKTQRDKKSVHIVNVSDNNDITKIEKEKKKKKYFCCFNI